MGYVALCAYREARGEGEQGIIGQMNVVGNRARNWYYHIADPYHYAIYLKGQFTSMSDPSDPNYRLFPADDDPIWHFCLSKAQELVIGTLPDNTCGALYYCNLKTMDQHGWFARNIIGSKAHPLLVTINHTSFYA